MTDIPCTYWSRAITMKHFCIEVFLMGHFLIFGIWMKGKYNSLLIIDVKIVLKWSSHSISTIKWNFTFILADNNRCTYLYTVLFIVTQGWSYGGGSKEVPNEEAYDHKGLITKTTQKHRGQQRKIGHINSTNSQKTKPRESEKEQCSIPANQEIAPPENSLGKWSETICCV